MAVNRFQAPFLGAPLPSAIHRTGNVRGLWRSRATALIIPLPPTSVPLTTPQNLRTACQIFADITNGTVVTIGPPGIAYNGATVPTSCYAQLSPGQQAIIFVDDPMTEYFDLSQFFAVLPTLAVATARLYLTFWDMV